MPDLIDLFVIGAIVHFCALGLHLVRWMETEGRCDCQCPLTMHDPCHTPAVDHQHPSTEGRNHQ